MARDITTAQATAAAAPVVHLALLVEMDFAPDPLRLWSGLGDFTWNNRTFTGAGTLLGVSAVEETTEVRAAATALSLSGVPGEIIDHALEVDWQGRAARVWLALLSETGAPIGDPVQVLAGRMDTLSWAEGATATVTMSVENRLVDLERPRVRRFNSSDQQSEYPGDLGFDYLPSMLEKEIRWGST